MSARADLRDLADEAASEGCDDLARAIREALDGP